MIGAFISVTARSFKNRIVQRVRRLKQPRYLVGGLFAILYFWSIFFKNRHTGRALAALGASDLRIDIVSVSILGMLLFAWALPSDSGGLTFSEAEIAFLFPAPLRRRDLLLYKIIRSQPQILVSSLAVTILGVMRARFVGIWVAFTALSIYFTLVALGRARLKLMRIGFIARAVGVGAIAIVLVNIAMRANNVHITLTRYDPRQLAQIGHAYFTQPFVRKVLFVPRAFATAIFPTSITALVIACGVLIALSIVFFFIAALLNVSFEEGSIVRAQRRLEMRARMAQRHSGHYVRFRRLSAPFRLGETGRPEVAILWKNVIATMRLSLPTIIIFAAVFVFVFAMRIFVHDVDTEFMSMMFLIMACFLPIIGPNLFTNDLRLDLPRFEMLKSYPLSGDLVVAAEIAAPLVVISVFEIAALLCFLVTSAAGNGHISFVTATQAVMCALIVSIPFCALQLLIRNALPVLFPAWATRPKEDVRGFAVGGQRLLLLMANLAILGVLILPAALVFVPSLLIAEHFFSGTPIAYALMTVPAAAVLACEVWLGVRFLGGKFDELDVSVDLDAVSM